MPSNAVRADLRGNRVWVVAPWSPVASRDAKSIPGANWRATSKCWTYPLSMSTCRALRRVYGERLEIGPELWAWASNEKKQSAELQHMGRQLDAHVELVPDIAPGLAAAMDSRTYQRSGAVFAAKAKQALLADQPSLGKTAMALAAIMEAGMWYGRHLVVAPKTSLSSTWERQVREWTGANVVAMPEGKAARSKALEEFAAMKHPAFLCVNPAMIQTKIEEYCPKCDMWWRDSGNAEPEKMAAHYAEGHKTHKAISKQDWPDLWERPWDTVILDESHEVLSAYAPSNVSQTAEGLFRLPVSGMRLALTGTPMRGQERKLWGHFDWLGRWSGGYWSWVDSFFEKESNGFGFEIKGLHSDKTAEFHDLLDTFVLRRTKQEVQPDLPHKDIQPVWVQMSTKQARQYDEFAAEGEARLESGTVSSLGVLSELVRMKQFSFGVWDVREDGKMIPTGESPKIDWLIQALAERGVTGNPKTEFLPEDGGHKYVVSSQFTEVVEAVAARLGRLGIDVLKITGAVTGKKRTTARDTFQSPNGPRVMLINTKAGGVSIDLDAYCDEMFILDETFVADDQEQLEGRIDNRSGRVAVRTFHYVRMEGSIEESIAVSNISQDEMQKQILDRRRGAEVAIRLLRKS